MLQLKINYEGQVYDILIEKDSSIRELKEKLKNELEHQLNIRTNINDIILKMGFPPKTIEYDSKKLSESNINDRELIRLTFATEPKQIIKNTSLIRKIIPADNSCLFNSINYAMNNNINEPSIMRELISVEIKSNPELYNTAILEKDPYDYCDWIMRDDTWGGGIELSILSKCFQLIIAVVDIKNLAIEYFGEVYYVKIELFKYNLSTL
jgi:hypothetical protein